MLPLPLFTDVCNSTDLPEVEIISLLEEQLPHYKLRADTIYGYDHDDWLHTPLISPDANIDLTTEQIEETLKYFRKSKYINLHVSIRCLCYLSRPPDILNSYSWINTVVLGMNNINHASETCSCYKSTCMYIMQVEEIV